jgi:hypothetical protein
MSDGDLALLTLLRDAPLSAVTSSGSVTALVLGPDDLARRLGAQHLRIEIADAAPLLFEPWNAVPALPLSEALAEDRLVVIGYAAERDQRGLLLLAASPPLGLARREGAFNGGRVRLSGSLAGIETDAGIRVAPEVLRRAAVERVREQLATHTARDLEQRLRAILADSLDPLMASAGFRGTASFCHRVGCPVTHFVELIHSRFNTAVEIGFNFNLGACLGDLSAGRITKQRLIADGFPAIIRPIGALWGEPGAAYALRPDTNPDDVAQRIVNDFATQALPWLHTLDTVDALVAFLDHEDAARGGHANALFAGMLLARSGRTGQARVYFRMAEGPPEAIARMAESVGIRLDGGGC